MNLSFDKAQTEDIEPIYSFCRDIIYKYEDIDKIDLEKVLKWVKEKIEDNIHEYVCVFADGSKAGYYRTHSENGKTELDDLYVFPQYQGQGIGTRVIEKCCAETSEPVFLYVFIRNTEAVKLYKRLGFETVQTIRDSRYIMQRD